VPPEAGLGILGTLFSSWIFPSHAPEGSFVLRTMVGGALDPEVDSQSDAELVQRVTDANQQLLGPMPSPSLVRVTRHPQGIPQPCLGHSARIARIREGLASAPGLFLAGNYLSGVGVKDCVRESHAVSAAVSSFLAG
jgi:oxygen-dependent protoporphyrinogen oxidase